MRGTLALAGRELKRFYRDRSRVIGALFPPLLFWLLIGSGLGDSFRPPGAPAGLSYLQYFFPGTLLLIVLFTAIFSTISVIEDRREGFLQAVLVSPVPRSAVAAGKVLGGSALAFLQGLVFLALAPAAGLDLTAAGLAYALALLLLASLGLTGLGFLIAWRLDSTQGFHAVMNLFLIPMWMLSGALFPADGAPAWLKALIAVNPLTYAVLGLQAALSASPSAGPPPAACLAVLAAFAAATFAASVAAVRRGA